VKHINELRTTLGEVIAAVRSGELDIERAKAIKGLADSVIDTAKVEVEFCRATGSATGTGFVADAAPALPAAGATTQAHLAHGVVREVTHQNGVTRTVNRAR
jgi:hypothetical protein